MRLLYLNNSEIEDLIVKFDKDTKALKHELLTMCWYMRGGLSFSEILQMSFDEREIINDIIKHNLETTKETQLTFF